ncbi:Hypothetical predicted protein [Octopus vulgaris]|uniref:Uncharacterized protein n=1 Tax=Octopus vulgaris TaxID=6645 RepID=A0AA36EZC9_OCTVU|nr:Hypothetical predicted protein [Octopus vulgaris]
MLAVIGYEAAFADVLNDDVTGDGGGAGVTAIDLVHVDPVHDNVAGFVGGIFVGSTGGSVSGKGCTVVVSCVAIFVVATKVTAANATPADIIANDAY